jgi:uncharacterized protein
VPGWYRWDGPDLVLQLHVQPRASHEALAGVSEQGLKVRLSTPPVDGRANEALQALLSREFGVPKAHVLLERGASGRRKQVRIRSPRRFPAVLPEIQRPA